MIFLLEKYSSNLKHLLKNMKASNFPVSFLVFVRRELQKIRKAVLYKLARSLL